MAVAGGFERHLKRVDSEAAPVVAAADEGDSQGAAARWSRLKELLLDPPYAASRQAFQGLSADRAIRVFMRAEEVEALLAAAPRELAWSGAEALTMLDGVIAWCGAYLALHARFAYPRDGAGARPILRLAQEARAWHWLLDGPGAETPVQAFQLSVWNASWRERVNGTDGAARPSPEATDKTGRDTLTGRLLAMRDTHDGLAQGYGRAFADPVALIQTFSLAFGVRFPFATRAADGQPLLGSGALWRGPAIASAEPAEDGVPACIHLGLPEGFPDREAAVGRGLAAAHRCFDAAAAEVGRDGAGGGLWFCRLGDADERYAANSLEAPVMLAGLSTLLRQPHPPGLLAVGAVRDDMALDDDLATASRAAGAARVVTGDVADGDAPLDPSSVGNKPAALFGAWRAARRSWPNDIAGGRRDAELKAGRAVRMALSLAATPEGTLRLMLTADFQSHVERLPEGNIHYALSGGVLAIALENAAMRVERVRFRVPPNAGMDPAAELSRPRGAGPLLAAAVRPLDPENGPNWRLAADADVTRPRWRLSNVLDGMPLAGRIDRQDLGEVRPGAGEVAIHASFIPRPADLVIENESDWIPAGLSRNKVAAARIVLWRLIRHRLHPHACKVSLIHGG